MWSSESDIPGLTRPLVPCSVLTWPRGTERTRGGLLISRRLALLPRAPNGPAWLRPKPASRRAAPSRNIWETPLTNGFVRAAGRAGPAPGLLLGSPPWVPGCRTIWRVQTCVRLHIPVWRPQDPPTLQPRHRPQPLPSPASWGALRGFRALGVGGGQVSSRGGNLETRSSKKDRRTPGHLLWGPRGSTW